MKIYTRSGDAGQTSLIYGHRVDKDALRVQAYGTVDEANSSIGLAIALLPEETSYVDLHSYLTRVQRDLFDVGRDLATPEDKRDGLFITADDVNLLEQIIDRVESENTPLHQFVLPGGHPAAAALHHTRTVTRRAERMVVALSRQETVSADLQKYLNRLSDLLFVLARCVNRRTNWQEPGVDFQSQKTNPLQTFEQ
ncbi:cob(I)yrinic acid a,c-diamide adenosyltransferase [Alicyclobacillaceae bacterium I2511]|nr:cob(I)yrinic acid a,c-diamide adenosyltransferase [Alicyclobacillaceae bacterium I2511]